MTKNTQNSFLWKASTKTKSLIIAGLLCLAGNVTAQSFPAIDSGSNCSDCVPTGWTKITSTPDMLLSNGDGIDAGRRVYGISGTSPQGGRMMHLGWVRAGGYIQESVSTTISGLTNSKKYEVILYAQGARYDGPYAYGGGKLEIKINGTLISSPLFPDSEWDTDSWRKIVVPFTATGSTATLELSGAEQENVNFRRGSIVVDGGGAGSVVEVLPSADLEMTKWLHKINNGAIINSTSNPAVNVGDEVEFEVTVKNNGPEDMPGVKVKDNLPNGYTYVSHSTLDGTYNSTTGIWDIGDVQNGHTKRLYIKATVNATGNHTNTASIDSLGGTDPNTGNNEASAGVTVTASGDLFIRKMVHKVNGVNNNSSTTPSPSVNVGDEIEFEIDAVNNGPSDMTGIKVKDLLPNGYTYVSHSTIDGTYNSTTGIWDVGGSPSGGIPNGWTRYLYIKATVNATGNLTNTATIDSYAGTDPNTGNNEASASVTVNCTNPTISSISPATQTVAQNGTPTNLSVTATGATSYQWYSRTTAGTTGGTLIPGATAATYTPSTSTSGTIYYYVVATNSCGSTTSATSVSMTTTASTTCNAGTVAPVVN